MKRQHYKGFTLAELLIALAILGVIATFTIPKILDSSTDSKYGAVAKEAASIISGAYATFKLNSTAVATTSAADFTSYINYVKTDTASTFSAPVSGQRANTCSATAICLVLHNGGILQYDSDMTFSVTGTSNSIMFEVDPDGTKAGAGSINFVQFYNGRLSTGGAAGSFTYSAGAALALNTIGTDPSYLSSWN